jgi:hypothetical protein
MPTIQINPQYFIDLGQMPFPVLLVRLFLDGGWIPVLIILLQGFWMLWVQSRQAMYASTITYTLLAIDIPRANEQTPKAVEQVFSHLSAAYSGLDSYEKYWVGKFQPTFSFELVSIEGYVQFVVRTPTKFRDLIEAAFFAQYPDAEIIEIADYTDKVPTTYPHPEWDLFGTEYILKKPNAYPIRTYPQFEHTIAEVPILDPISSILEVMGSLKRGEQLWLQILVTPNDDSWKDAANAEADKIAGKKKVAKKSIIDEAVEIPKSVITELTGIFAPPEGGEKKKDEPPKILQLTPGEKNVLEAIQLKTAKIGFNCKMRLVYAGRRDTFSKGRVTSLKGALGQFAALNMNSFKNYGAVTPKSDYFWQRWSEPAKKMAVLRNYRNRSGRGAPPYVLNIEELATIYHFPMLQVKAPLVKKTEAKRAEPPVSLPTAESIMERPFTRIAPKPKEAPKKAPPTDEELDEEFGGEAPANLPFA